jgi:hypothetical protein
MDGRRLLPRLQGQVAREQTVRASWYRVFVADFDSREAADRFCGKLMARLQRCRTLSAAEMSEVAGQSASDGIRSAVPPMAEGATLVDLVTAQDGASAAAGRDGAPVAPDGDRAGGAR